MSVTSQAAEEAAVVYIITTRRCIALISVYIVSVAGPVGPAPVNGRRRRAVRPVASPPPPPPTDRLGSAWSAPDCRINDNKHALSC